MQSNESPISCVKLTLAILLDTSSNILCLCFLLTFTIFHISSYYVKEKQDLVHELHYQGNLASFPLTLLSEEVRVFSIASLGSVLVTHHGSRSNCFSHTLYYKNTSCTNNHFSLFSVNGNGIGLQPPLKSFSAMRLDRRLSESTLVWSLQSPASSHQTQDIKNRLFILCFRSLKSTVELHNYF